MKNLLKKFSFVFLVLGLSFAVVACGDDDDDHKHEYVNGVCSCGEKDPNHTHNYVNGVCACGEVDPNYNEPTVKISFEENGGNNVQDVVIKVADLSSYSTSLPTATKYGCIFGGWYADAGLSQASTIDTVKAALASGDVTLYAKWTVDTELYYQSAQSEDLGSVNYWDSKESTVGNLIGYVHNGFWGNAINEYADGYDWINVIANEKPRLLESIKDENGDDIGLGTKFEFEVKVGADLVYNTLSTNPKFAAFKGREVQPEDYLTMWKHMYNQSNGIERGAEGLEGAGSVKGIAEYYEATKNPLTDEELDAAWEQVCYDIVERDGKWYIQVEFNVPTNEFYAMYYLASSLYTPMPEEFIEAVGGLQYYGTFSSDNTLSPVDTILSTGYYVVENWELSKEIVFVKNELVEDGGRYKFLGIHIQTITAALTDREAVFKEFLAGHLDTAGIPSTQLESYMNHDLTTVIPDSSTYKLNINSCTEEMWEELFGENGTITRTTKDQYWDVEPIMSNKNFLRGLSYSINRKEYAETIGATPTANYFGSDYLSDPENGVTYNSTEAHKKATETSLANTDGYGYNLSLAQTYFKMACDELIANGTYSEGETIEIEICWQSQAQADEEGVLLAKYIEDAFNSCGGKLTVKCVHWVAQVWTDVYYKKMMIGQFDLGFGSVSGNPLNPLNFFEVLRSDNTSTFTLNWGVDTNEVTDQIVYNGQEWSFNALWEAADRGAYVVDGALAGSLVDAVLTSRTVNSDGSLTYTFKWAGVVDESAKFSVAKVVACNYELYHMSGQDIYEEKAIEFTEEGNVITATVPADLAQHINGSIGFDIFFNADVAGVPGTKYVSFYSNTIETSTAVTDYLGIDEPNADATPVVPEGGKVYSFVAASYEERTEILGILEKYAVENFIAGLTLYGDGGYSMHSDRLVPGSGSWDNYIPGYGFGVFSEGYATKHLVAIQ